MSNLLEDYPRITIKGLPGVWVLMDDDHSESGAITTEESFANFTESFAHMFDGTIQRYGQMLCNRDGWDYVIEADTNSQIEGGDEK